MHARTFLLAGTLAFFTACQQQQPAPADGSAADTSVPTMSPTPARGPLKMTLTVEPNGVVRLGDRAVRTEQLEQFLTDTLRQFRQIHGRLPDSLLMMPDPRTPRNTLLIINDIVQTATTAAQQ